MESLYRTARQWSAVGFKAYWWFGYDENIMGRVELVDEFGQKTIQPAVLGDLTLDCGNVWEVLVEDPAIESIGKQPVTHGVSKMGVTGSLEWSSTYELRATLPYTQRLRGAVARNQPDRDNEQRYESWLARVSSAGLPASLTVNRLTNEHSSGRVVAVDGEGAAAINRAFASALG
jgi:hypothetical protein